MRGPGADHKQILWAFLRNLNPYCLHLKNLLYTSLSYEAVYTSVAAYLSVSLSVCLCVCVRVCVCLFSFFKAQGLITLLSQTFGSPDVPPSFELLFLKDQLEQLGFGSVC